MKPAERERAIRSIDELVHGLAQDLGPARAALRNRTAPVARIRAADPNGGGCGGGGGPSDATGSSVADAENEKVDAQLDRWDMWLDDAYHVLSKLTVEVGVVLRPPAEPAPIQRKMIGCESCARDRVTTPGERYFEPVAFGRYAKFCRPCGEYFAAERELPPVDAVVWMHRFGKTWTSKVLTDAKRAATARRRKSA